MVTGTAKGWREVRQTVKVEAPVEDGLPGGGRHTESRTDQMEGGAREKTGGSRRSQTGPRPQPGWRSQRREEPWWRKG